MGFIIHFYIIFATNLLTGGPARIAVFCLFQCFEEKEYRTESKRNETFWRSYFWKESNPGDLKSTSRKQRGRHEAGGAPPPSWTGCGPPDVDSSSSIFNIFQKYLPWSFRSFRELLFLHINNTVAILLKTASVRVSSIQIMQVRVQNKGKSVWKSRYVGDVSNPPKLKPLLALKQFS